MSAIGSAIATHRSAPRFISISAHADLRRDDLVFARTQSPMLRDAPWAHRLKPLKSWSEIGSYCGVALAAATVLTTTLLVTLN